MSVTRFFSVALSAVLIAGAAAAQDPGAKPDNVQAKATSSQSTQQQKAAETDPLKRSVPEKLKKEQAKRFKEEVGRSYKKWLNEDVRWIITPEEEQAFKQLSNDEERDNFIEQFWLRRDPTPDTQENEFKEEHYRRIAYANEHFAAGIPGWKTDRGRMYVMYGPADEIESHPSGGSYERPPEEGGGSTSTYPFETWRYRYLEGIGQEVIIEFVDPCMCGEYHMTMDRSEKDALLHVPGAGLTMYESMGMASKANRFNNGIESLGTGPFTSQNQSKQFDRLEQFAKLSKPPAIKFKDLEEVVSHKISVNLLPFEVRADFVKVTGDTVLVPLTLQVKNRDVTFVNKDGIQRGVVNIFGRLTTMTGKIAQTFEDTVTIEQPAELLPKVLDKSSIYWKALPLRPGRYRMDLVLKDVNGDRVGTWSRGIMVPDFGDERLAASSLILADQMERVPAKNVGSGNFVIGNTKVRPRVEDSTGKPVSFRRDQKANFWMQVYNLGISDQTKKPSATVEYNILDVAKNKAVVHTVENTDQMGNVGEQMTLEKSLPLSNLDPGVYQITIKISDNISKQTITPTAKFVIE